MKYRTWKFAISKCIAWEGIQHDSSFKDFVYEDRGKHNANGSELCEKRQLKPSLERTKTNCQQFFFHLPQSRSRYSSALLNTWNSVSHIFHCFSSDYQIPPK